MFIIFETFCLPLQRTGIFASNNKEAKIRTFFFVQPIQFGPTVLVHSLGSSPLARTGTSLPSRLRCGAVEGEGEGEGEVNVESRGVRGRYTARLHRVAGDRRGRAGLVKRKRVEHVTTRESDGR